MKDENFISLDVIPSDHQGSFLYSSSHYLNNLKTEVIGYCIIDQNTKLVLLTIHFQIFGKEAVSLKDAPFGGLDVASNVDIIIVNKFLKFVISNLKGKDMEQIVIKTAPPFYKPNYVKKLEELMSTFGSAENLIEINHHIEITQFDLATYMTPMELRKLRKCQNSKFEFLTESQSELPKLYEFIANCREAKKQSLSMSYNDLEHALSGSSGSYLLFAVYNQSELIAASICVVVNSKILYNFYPASKPSYNTYSPTVLLLSGIYEYCQENNFKILDLGTSMLERVPNKGLIQFKENVGGTRTQREVIKLLL